MNYAGIIKNDIAAGKGINVTFFVSGCPLHCKGCHNKEEQNFNYGKEFTKNTYKIIKKALKANGVQRNFSLMGGEPLCKDNIETCYQLLSKLREDFPTIKIYVWTGYTLDKIKNEKILNLIDVLIDGPYVEELRDITLEMRGSSNQRILYKGKDF